MTTISDRNEWLEPDGLGGFASGTVSGVRTRRYHALLLTATTPPTGRVVLVNGVDAWVETDGAAHALSTQHYEPGVRHPDGSMCISAFTTEPWPTWTFSLPCGATIEHTITVQRGTPAVALAWRLIQRGDVQSGDGTDRVTLRVRPFLSGRDYHGMQRENENKGQN